MCQCHEAGWFPFPWRCRATERRDDNERYAFGGTRSTAVNRQAVCKWSLFSLCCHLRVPSRTTLNDAWVRRRADSPAAHGLPVRQFARAELLHCSCTPTCSNLQEHSEAWQLSSFSQTGNACLVLCLRARLRHKTGHIPSAPKAPCCQPGSPWYCNVQAQHVGAVFTEYSPPGALQPRLRRKVRRSLGTEHNRTHSRTRGLFGQVQYKE